MCFPGASNVGDTLPTGQLSNVPWRRVGVKYTNNEAYFDVIEEIDAILDKSGTIHLYFDRYSSIVLVSSISWSGDSASHLCHICINLSYSGTTVFAEIQGVIEACVRLTGMPDLTLSFMVGSFPLRVMFYFCLRVFFS